MNICKDLFIGNTKTGEKYYLTIELRERTNGVSVDHLTIENYQELSFTGVLISKYGSVTYDRGAISYGQNYEYLLEITKPAKGFNKETTKRIYELWREYHLNDMNSHCAHQDKAIKWDLVDPCPITGYRAGSAWLVRELPESVIGEIKALTGKVLVGAN
jgi:hypothetical protein